MCSILLRNTLCATMKSKLRFGILMFDFMADTLHPASHQPASPRHLGLFGASARNNHGHSSSLMFLQNLENFAQVPCSTAGTSSTGLPNPLVGDCIKTHPNNKSCTEVLRHKWLSCSAKGKSQLPFLYILCTPAFWELRRSSLAVYPRSTARVTHKDKPYGCSSISEEAPEVGVVYFQLYQQLEFT